MRSHDPEGCQTANMYNLWNLGVCIWYINWCEYYFQGAGDVWISLRGTTYQNNSNVTLEDIGDNNDTALVCVTNLTTCCRPPYTGENGSVLGNWFFPNGTQVPSGGDQGDFHKTRGQMEIALQRRRGGEEGIYHCEIPDSMNIVQTIYIGVYSANTGEWQCLYTLVVFNSTAVLTCVARVWFMLSHST